MKGDAEHVAIRRAARPQECKEVAEFIVSEFFRCFGTSPPPSEILFGAYREGAIVGAVALDFADDDNPLPFERIYDCSGLSDLPKCRARSAQFGKWRATVPGIAGALIYAAAIYALREEKSHGWFIAKPKAAGRMQSLGIALRRHKAELIRGNTPEGDRPYYGTSPVPQLFSMDLRQVEGAIGNAIRPLLRKKYITLHI